jgi:hypothetical protein
MRIKASALLVAAAFALPALAQTEAQPAAKADANTQKLWKIETSGIGG